MSKIHIVNALLIFSAIVLALNISYELFGVAHLRSAGAFDAFFILVIIGSVFYLKKHPDTRPNNLLIYLIATLAMIKFSHFIFKTFY